MDGAKGTRKTTAERPNPTIASNDNALEAHEVDAPVSSRPLLSSLTTKRDGLLLYTGQSSAANWHGSPLWDLDPPASTHGGSDCACDPLPRDSNGTRLGTPSISLLTRTMGLSSPVAYQMITGR